MYSKYQIGKLFWKYELLLLDEGNSSSDPSQLLIQQFPILELPCLPDNLCQILPYPTKTLLQHNHHHVLNQFPYFVLPHLMTHHHNDWIYQTISQAKSIKFFTKLYTDHNTLFIKQATYQKSESFRDASLSKLDNTVNNNSIFNIRYAEFSRKW